MNSRTAGRLGVLTALLVALLLWGPGIVQDHAQAAAKARELASNLREQLGVVTVHEAQERGYTEVLPGMWMDCDVSRLDVVPGMREQAELTGHVGVLEEAFADLGGECPSRESLEAAFSGLEEYMAPEATEQGMRTLRESFAGY